MKKQSSENKLVITEGFIFDQIKLSKYPNNHFNNVYFDNMVSQIYPSELQLNKTNTSDTEATFSVLHLSISNISTKIYDKRDDIDFEFFNFPFLDGDVLRSTSYGVYIS